jgi:hypothetical protein
MSEQGSTSQAAEAPLDGLRRAKADSLKALMKKKPGQKHYKRTLRAFLEADQKLTAAIETKLELH